MDKKKARQLLAMLLGSTKDTWDTSDELLKILSELHGELRKLLIDSGLYTVTETEKLMAELDAIILNNSNEMSEFMKSAQLEAWMRGVDVTQNALSKVELKFVKGLSGLENPMVEKYLTTDRIVGVTEEMRAQVRSQVISGIMQEKTPQQVMSAITNIIGIRDERGYREIGTTGISAKAERIARTELLTINNSGAWYSRQQASKTFPDLLQVWIATSDDRTRFDHLMAHGQIVKIDEPFKVGGEEAYFPGDPNLSPAQRCNCRCTASPYREEWGDISEFTGDLDTKIEDEIDRRKNG